MDVTADKLVRVYIKMRDKRAALKASYEADDNQIKEQMALVEQHLLEVCKSTGAESIKTEHGTAIRSVQTRYWTGDWAAMHKFIRDNNALDLLERRISQLSMKTFLRENPDLMPVGLNVDNKYTVTVRRS
jgi:phage host-nuclease inhibitor protein Gam